MTGMHAPLVERFWAKVDKDGPRAAHMPTNCWTWTASLDRRGYGQLQAGVTVLKAHRVSWWLANGGPIHPLICHHCDIRICVRPDHLYAGTHAENSHDALTRWRVGHLTPAMLDTIDTLAGREPDRVIAERLGVSRSVVNAARNRRTYRHYIIRYEGE